MVQPAVAIVFAIIAAVDPRSDTTTGGSGIQGEVIARQSDIWEGGKFDQNTLERC
jgi:hypothetical protein